MLTTILVFSLLVRMSMAQGNVSRCSMPANCFRGAWHVVKLPDLIYKDALERVCEDMGTHLVEICSQSDLVTFRKELVGTVKTYTIMILSARCAGEKCVEPRWNDQENHFLSKRPTRESKNPLMLFYFTDDEYKYDLRRGNSDTNSRIAVCMEPVRTNETYCPPPDL